MTPAQRDHTSHELQHLPLCLNQVPIKPGELVVLTPGVVIATLGPPDFVAGQQHWDPSTDHQDRNEVLCLTATKGDHGGILRLAFNPAVPAQVVVGAVTVIFAIGLIVLMVVANKVAKSETVVASDEINAVFWQSSVISVEIAAAGNATGYFADDTAVAAHESPDHVAVATVPFGPRKSGKRANLVKTSGIPCLGNQREAGIAYRTVWNMFSGWP